mgnify:CR=1 FL=1|jgi:hypothetical protein
MNLSPSNASANGRPAGSNASGSSAYLPNGGISKPVGLNSLRLPVVVVPNLKFSLPQENLFEIGLRQYY